MVLEKWGYRDANLHMGYAWVKAGATIFKKAYGITYSEVGGFWKGELFTWYENFKELDKVGEFITKKILENPKYFNTIYKNWKLTETRLFDLTATLKNKDFSRLSNEELRQLEKKKNDLWEDLAKGYITDTLQVYLSKKIRHKLKQRLKDLGMTSGFNKYYETLTAPVTLSFAAKEELELIGIAEDLQGMKKFVIKSSVKKIKAKIKKDLPNLYKKLQKHEEEYFWLGGNYIADPAFDTDYFLQKIKELFMNKTDLKKKKKEIRELQRLNKKKKEKTMCELKLDQHFRDYMKLVDRLIPFHDERKRAVITPIYESINMTKEIGKRLGLNYKDVTALTSHEVQACLAGKPVDKKTVQERRKKMFLYVTTKKIVIKTGKEAERLFKEKVKREETDNLQDFEGLTANAGVAVGTVKIVKSVNDLDKIKKGDILVASITTPDFVPAMAKAAAFVTDEGGIACHTAIVAREMNKPCIIGTKIATQLLKDGDVVKVDANHGVVKILKRR